MKKFSTSVSPFLMLVIPVILFAGLSFTLKQNATQNDLSTSSFSGKITTTTMVKVGEESFIHFLLRK